MLAAYLDESFDSRNAGIFAVAAVFGDGWDVMKGETLWRGLLDRHGLKAFKSSRLRQRPGIVADFARAIKSSGLLACGMVTEQAVVLRHLDGSAFAEQYRRNPYMLAYHSAFIEIAMDLRRGKSEHLVAYVCDCNLRYLDILERSYPVLLERNPLSAVYMGSLSVKADDDCIPLQMADLIAGELRRAGLDWNERTDVSEALEVLKGVLWKVSLMDEGYLRAIRTHVDEAHPQA